MSVTVETWLQIVCHLFHFYSSAHSTGSLRGEEEEEEGREGEDNERGWGR